MATTHKLPSTAVGRRRLLKLAGLLEADAKNKKGLQFDLAGWGRVDDEAKPVSCGTTACAVGLAVASGAFKRAGLRGMGTYNLTPVFGIQRSWGAVKSLFEISYSEAEFLFMDSSYPSTIGATAERAVAARIRDFVAKKAAPEAV